MIKWELNDLKTWNSMIKWELNDLKTWNSMIKWELNDLKTWKSMIKWELNDMATWKSFSKKTVVAVKADFYTRRFKKHPSKKIEMYHTLCYYALFIINMKTFDIWVSNKFKFFVLKHLNCIYKDDAWQSINHYAISVQRFNSVFVVSKIYILLAMMHLWVIQNSLFLNLSERDERTALYSVLYTHT